MASVNKRHDVKIKKKALNMIQEVHRKIQEGELIVEDSGWRQGILGTWTFKIVVKENEDNRKLSNY